MHSKEFSYFNSLSDKGHYRIPLPSIFTVESPSVIGRVKWLTYLGIIVIYTSATSPCPFQPPQQPSRSTSIPYYLHTSGYDVPILFPLSTPIHPTTRRYTHQPTLSLQRLALEHGLYMSRNMPLLSESSLVLSELLLLLLLFS